MFFYFAKKEVLKLIGSSENRVSYNGNGLTTEFPYAFKVLEKTDLKLLLVSRDGTETVLTSDYYVDLEKKSVFYPGYSPGAEPPTSDRPPVLQDGERLVIYRDVPITQEIALDAHWPYNEIEGSIDKLTIIAQQLNDGVTRSLRVSNASDSEVESVVPVNAGKSFRWSDDGLRLETTEDPARVLPLAESVYQDTVAIKKQTATIKSETEVIKTEVGEIKDLARKWAEGEGSPDGVEGNRSAKGWAEYIEGSLSENASLSAIKAIGRIVNTTYSVGNVVYVDSNLSVALKCTTEGTTSDAELNISTNNIGDTVTDGSVVWEVVKRDLTDDVEGNLQYLLEELKKYLPLVGGVMIGGIVTSGKDSRTVVKRNDDISGVSLYGGSNYETGAVIALKGLHNSEVTGEEGGFFIATGGSPRYWLAGTKNGELKWNGSRVINGVSIQAQQVTTSNTPMYLPEGGTWIGIWIESVSNNDFATNGIVYTAGGSLFHTTAYNVEKCSAIYFRVI